MQGRSEVHLDAKCDRVPIFKFKGRIADESLKNTKWFMVQVKYRANWAPKFLGAEQAGVDQPVPEPPQFDVVSVPVAKNKGFSIDLPVLAFALGASVLTGILFILQTGLRWDLLPQEMGCGGGMSCWRRLRDWQAADSVGRAARNAACALACGRPDRLIPCHSRLLFNPCCGR